MAIFRKINVSFWEDAKVMDDMTPEDRYFMLYLMTNPHTTQSGCYSITIRQIEFETGYNKDTILKLLKRFEEILKIIEYSNETKEILIKHWYKYNWTKSPKVLSCVVKEAKSIKNKEFRYCIDTLLIQYGYSMDTETQEEQEQEQDLKEQEKEKDFELFWKSYPNHKTNKKKSFEYFKEALEKTSLENLLSSVKKYKDYIEKNNIEEKFISYPYNWLKEERWLDEYNTSVDDGLTEMEREMLEKAKEYGGIYVSKEDKTYD